jgi:hypothetical protein
MLGAFAPVLAPGPVPDEARLLCPCESEDGLSLRHLVVGASGGLEETAPARFVGARALPGSRPALCVSHEGESLAVLLATRSVSDEVSELVLLVARFAAAGPVCDVRGWEGAPLPRAGQVEFSALTAERPFWRAVLLTTEGAVLALDPLGGTRALALTGKPMEPLSFLVTWSALHIGVVTETGPALETVR